MGHAGNYMTLPSDYDDYNHILRTSIKNKKNDYSSQSEDNQEDAKSNAQRCKIAPHKRRLSEIIGLDDINSYAPASHPQDQQTGRTTIRNTTRYPRIHKHPEITTSKLKKQISKCSIRSGSKASKMESATSLATAHLESRAEDDDYGLLKRIFIGGLT